MYSVLGSLDRELRIALRYAIPARKPLKTGYGSWAKYGTAPSTEEIDENRREMIPSGIATGPSVPVAFTVGTKTSQPGVTIAVH